MHTLIKRALALVLMLFIFTNVAAAQSATATQTVTVAVNAITLVSVTGTVTLTVLAGTAGENILTAVTNGTTSYSITHNKGTVKKITAGINSNLPSGIALKATLTSTKGTSAGQQLLSTVAVDVVTAVAKGADKDQPIAYELTANADAGELASVVKTVTFTLTD